MALTESGLKKGPWTAAEDAILLEYVQKHGEGNWNAVQKSSGLLRCGKSCRLRWANHLRPNLKKGSFSPDEEHLIVRLHAQLGNKWARMAALLPGRTDNEIKNYWNTRIKRRQRTGLPLYPPEIQRRAAARHHQTSPSTFKVSSTPLSLSDQIANLPMVQPSVLLLAPNSFTGNPILELPPIKTSSLPPPPLYQHQQHHTVDHTSSNPDASSPFSLETELPSAQLFSDNACPGVDTGELLDALLQRSHGLADTSDHSIGINMNSVPPSTMVPKRHNISSEEMSNGQQTSSLSISPVGADWYTRSCSWNNMPSIC